MRIIIILFFSLFYFNSFTQENVKTLDFEETLLFELDAALQEKDYIKAKEIIIELNNRTKHLAYINSLMSKNGLILEGMIGLAGLNINRPSSALNSSIKFGYKAYLGKKKMFNSGIQVFTKFSLLSAIEFNWSLVNVGVVNAFDFANNRGVEFNLNAGFNLNLRNPFLLGFDLNPVMLFKFKKFSYGLEYSGIIYPTNNGVSSLNSLNIVFGAKF